MGIKAELLLTGSNGDNALPDLLELLERTQGAVQLTINGLVVFEALVVKAEGVSQAAVGGLTLVGIDLGTIEQFSDQYTAALRGMGRLEE